MADVNLEEIINGCLANQQPYQKLLYQFCFSNMMQICLRYNQNMDDAQACYNTAMMKVFSKIAKYRNEGSFIGWIGRIVTNTCITEIKKRSRFESKSLSVEEDNIMLPHLQQDISAQEILQLVQKLPPTHCLVFNLYVIEGYNHDEISKMLGVAAGTSKWYLSDARSKLKKCLTTIYANEIITT